jgi:hypothetical protein
VTTTAIEDTDARRQVTLLKAVGLDRLAPEQRELALNLARRYELDLLLKHLVLIEGRAYITRDGLLHIAHRSGAFDGMEATDATLDGDFWHASCAVYRTDMSRPFRYSGRYPAKGGNQKYAPEMAVKVAEVAALRRAFDVSAPTVEERWDEAEVPVERPTRPTLVEIAEKRAVVAPPEPEPVPDEYVEAVVDAVLTEEATPMTAAQARVSFAKATALLPTAVVTGAARTTFPGIAGKDYTLAHYEALAAALREAGYPVEL